MTSRLPGEDGDHPEAEEEGRPGDDREEPEPQEDVDLGQRNQSINRLALNSIG